MEIIGRVTKDATVRKLKDGRELVVFSIAINDYFKTKTGEKREETTYVNCSYWVNVKAAELIRKGGIVSLFGRIGLNAYKSMEGDFHAHLTFHVNAFKVITQQKKGTAKEYQPASAGADNDDLPF
jgi:single-strand DNA-binding protein